MRCNLALSLLAQGRTEETIATARQEPVEWSRLRALAIIYHESGREAESSKALRELVETLAEDGAFQIAGAQASRRSELCTSERMVFHRRYRILMAFPPERQAGTIGDAAFPPGAVWGSHAIYS